MSVCFSVLGKTPDCTCVDTSGTLCPKCGNALFDPVCECMYICDACTNRMFTMANSNAREFLSRLGLESRDLCGEASSHDLRKRAAALLSSNRPDPAIEPSVESGPDGQARVIGYGRPQGYLHEKAEAVLRLCDMAGDLGRISWG